MRIVQIIGSAGTITAMEWEHPCEGLRHPYFLHIVGRHQICPRCGNVVFTDLNKEAKHGRN